MPPGRSVRGRLTRRNVNPSCLEVHTSQLVQPPQEEVTNVEFQNVIQMSTQVRENQVGHQRVDHQDVADTSLICRFLRMNPKVHKVKHH